MYILIYPNGQIAVKVHATTMEQHDAIQIIKVDGVEPEQVVVVKSADGPVETTRYGKPATGSLLAWVTGGMENTWRKAEIFPVKNSDESLVRVKLTVETSETRPPTATAEGEGDTIQDAFAAAYTELVQWLI